MMKKYLLAFLIVCAFAMQAMALTLPDSTALNAQFKTWDTQLAGAVDYITEHTGQHEKLADFKVKLQTIHAAAVKLRNTQRTTVDTLADILGSQAADKKTVPDGEAVAAPAPQVASKDELQKHYNTALAQLEQLKTYVTRTDHLIELVHEAERVVFRQRIFQKQASPLNPLNWPKAGVQLYELMSTSVAKLQDTRPANNQQDFLHRYQVSLMVATGVLMLLLFFSRWVVQMLFSKAHQPEQPDLTYKRKLVLAHVLAKGVLPASAWAFAGLLALNFANMPHNLKLFLQYFLPYLVLLSFLSSYIRAVLRPRHEDNRVLDISTRSARSIKRNLDWFYLLWIGYGLLVAFMAVAPGFDALYKVVRLGIAGSLFVFVMLALRSGNWRAEGRAETRNAAAATPVQKGLPMHGRMRLVARFMALVPVLASSFGYAVFTDYMLRNILFTMCVLAGFRIVRLLLRAALFSLIEMTAGTEEKHALKSGAQDGDDLSVSFFRFWSELGIDLIIWSATLVALLPLWGMSLDELFRYIIKLSEGVRIGSFVISPTDIFMGIFVFILVFGFTRYIQRLLQEKILPQTRLDKGVRHSLRAGVGYVGFVLAAALSISAMGIDLSSLALIAGALSVGIGFGLQNVVSNFVSSLVLLVERPVKVGDWVKIGAEAGRVTKINVRSTELETRKRETVIIPNSELISTQVLNWSHSDFVGRIEVGIGVKYGTDVEKVREILLQIARANTDVAGWPEPHVTFKDFGASSLDFELRVFLRDVSTEFHTASDLRFDIYKRFTEENIEIPFPQQDLHLKDIDRLADIFTQAAKAQRTTRKAKK